VLTQTDVGLLGRKLGSVSMRMVDEVLLGRLAQDSLSYLYVPPNRQLAPFTRFATQPVIPDRPRHHADRAMS
jgi:hypothetical protein